MRGHVIAWAIALGAVAEPVSAQSLTGDAVASRAIARACEGFEGAPLSRERLAEALVVESRVAPTLSQMAQIAAEIAENGSSPQVNTTYRKAITVLEAGLARPGSAEAKAIHVTPAAPEFQAGALDWLFGGEHSFRCAPAKDRAEPAFAELPPVIVRGSVDALDDVGEARQTSVAAQIAWERHRVTDLDGETTRTEAFAIDATVGLALGDSDQYGILYSDYSRHRTETRSGAGERDIKSVEALELGLLGTTRLAGLRTTGRLALTFDEVSNASYLRGNLKIVPITGGRVNLGVCNLGSFRTIAGNIRAQCILEGEVELREVLERGSADIGATDILFAAGGTVGIEFGPGIDANGDVADGVVASARYTYMAVFEGALEDIDRFDASLSYRWWAGPLGFDLGLTYADGTERKSFSDENTVAFHIGLIY